MNTTTSQLRLPKILDTDPRSNSLLSKLEKQSAPLRLQSTVMVANTHLDNRLAMVLKDAYVKGHIVRGLEGAERTLAAEERGLRIADRKSEQTRGVRISRLLLMTDDGSDRFYRQVEKLLLRHGLRVLSVRLKIDAGGLGEILFGPEKIARLIMINHKASVGSVLLALADQWTTS